MKQKRSVRNPYVAALIILVIAAWFRFTGINWDQNAHLHHDERFLTMVTTNIDWPKTIAEYFDTRASALNPHNKGFSFYVYGTYPVYVTKLMAQLIRIDTYNGITIVGRIMSGIVDLLTMLFVFLITSALISQSKFSRSHQIPNPKSQLGQLEIRALRSSPYLAMFLYGVMVLPIQLSHFFTVDPYATLFLTISLYLMIKRRIGWQLGIAVGLAVSAKISSLIIVPLVIWVARKNLRSLLPLLFSLLLTVSIAYPYLFDGWWLNQLVLDNWKQLRSFDGPTTTFPPGLQWINVPFWQPTWDMIVWGLGVPLGVLAVLSIFRAHPPAGGLLLSWVLLILGYQSFQFAKPMRYLYPIYPALAVFTAMFINKFRLYWVVPFVLIWPIAFISIYTRPHTRVAASTWIYANIPPGSTIAWEHWDDPLPVALGERNATQYRLIQLPIFDPETPEKWQKIQDVLAIADYLVLSSNRGYGSIAHAKGRYPQTNAYYQNLFSGRLGFSNSIQFTSRPMLWGIEIIDDRADESFTVYDHPAVMIFQRTSQGAPTIPVR